MARPRKQRNHEPRRKTNRYAAATAAQRELDFHEYGVLDAPTVRDMTREFVEDAQDAGLTRVRIITGKGLHSKGRPLVKPHVRRLLKELQDDGRVESFDTEKVDAGGAGAFAVKLLPR